MDSNKCTSLLYQDHGVTSLVNKWTPYDVLYTVTNNDWQSIMSNATYFDSLSITCLYLPRTGI